MVTYHSGPKLSVWVSAILPLSSKNMKEKIHIINVYIYTLILTAHDIVKPLLT